MPCRLIGKEASVTSPMLADLQRPVRVGSLPRGLEEDGKGVEWVGLGRVGRWNETMMGRRVDQALKGRITSGTSQILTPFQDLIHLPGSMQTYPNDSACSGPK